ncbi:Alkanesulfonates-binding protein [plant metagenome]|uniref:Alkanesulfonates-binding protein n=1 Tax=plant metagenome TaxID=1297885 RepID=A0A484PE30_9ZZZZ
MSAGTVVPRLPARAPAESGLAARIFADPRSQAMLAHVRQIGPSDASILIEGQTGTGKDLVARHVHEISARRDGPFLAVSCGAFSEALVDAELFGYEQGAFPGAFEAKGGWFEEADGGTLFLDQIGDLPLPTQSRLLRVLQEREVVRLGGRRGRPIDVRVLAATNVPLEPLIQSGGFRKDLYYRLNVVTLALPALAERPGDILPLARYFIERHAERLGHDVVALSRDAEAALRAHAWPGNVRELENVLHHALLVCRGQAIDAEDLHLAAPPLAATGLPPSTATLDELLEATFARLFEEQPEQAHAYLEEALLRTAYRYCRQNQVHTATLLGLSRNVTRSQLIRIGELRVSKRK